MEVGVNFFGRCGIWKELPKPDEIFDYERYTNPNYLLDNTNIEDQPITLDSSKSDFNFVL